MSENNGTCRTILLSDVPAGVDSFGPHTVAAGAITSLIGEEDGGITIGLQGNWGSGKSTIVNLIVDQLSEEQPQTAPILFDAWAHQNDPLRRSFLETLFDELEAREWVSQEILQDKRDILARRKKVAHKTSNPILKRLGVIMAGGFLLIPIGLSLLNSALGEGLTLNWSGWQNVSLQAFLGIVLAINPLILYVGAYLDWWIKKLRGKTKKEWSEAGGWNAVLLRKYSTEELTETISDQDPTSVEFERIFGSLLDTGLDNPERRIVLILDNLDRVDQDAALKVLSTLQTFMQEKFSRERDWFNRLWIIIPYAPDGMRQLLEGSSDASMGGNQGTGLTERFLEKRLQIRFEVPPIVRSDWGEFLKAQLRIAFPEHPKAENEFHLIYRLFDLARSERTSPPTPREIKLLVNQIGVLHRQWFDRYPMHHLAYYAVLSKANIGLVDKLRNGDLPDPALEGILGEDAADSLAALAFGVGVGKARELMLLPEVIDILRENNQTRLDELARFHPDGIWTVLERVPFDDWLESETGSLASAAALLDSFGFLDKAPAGPKQSTIRSLAEAFASVKRWEPLSITTGKGIAAMIRLKPDAVLAEKIILAIAAPISVEEGEEISERTVNWIDTLVPVLDVVYELELESGLRDRIPVPGNEAWLIKVVSSLQNDRARRAYIQNLRTELQTKDVAEHLRESISSGTLSLEEVNSFDAMRGLLPELDWEEVSEGAFQRLNAVGAYGPDEISGLLSALWKITTWETIPPDKLKQLADGGQVLHHLHHARTKDSAEATAWCMLTQVSMRPDASQPPNPAGSSADGWSFFSSALANPADHEKTHDEFSQLVDSQDQHKVMVEIANKVPEWRAWLFATIDDLISTGAGLKVVSYEDYAEKHDFLKANLQQESFSSLTQSLVNQGMVLDEVRRGAFDPESSVLYVDLLNAGAHENSEFNTWISKNLKAVDVQTWTAAIKGETPLIDLVDVRYEEGGRFKLGLPYADGLEEYAKALIGGQVSPDDPSNLSRKLLNVIWGKSDRSALQRRFLDSALAADGDIAPPFFDVFGDEIADVDMIRSDTNVVRRMFEPIVRKRNQRGLAWLASLFTREPNLLKGYTPQYDFTQLQARVEEVSGEELEEETAELIRTLANALGVEIIEIDEEEVASDSDE